MRDLTKDNFVKIPNHCFSRGSGESFYDIYGEKGLTMLIRMLQQRSSRGYYLITEAHIRSWFQYSRARYYDSILSILDRFKKDKIILFDSDYDFSSMYKGLIYYQPAAEFLPENKFFKLYDGEVDAILLHYMGAEDKYKLLALFACLKSYYNTKYKICSQNPSIETLSAEVGLSENTIQIYLDVLVDIGLILYGNPGTKLFPDNVVRECNNIYTMNYVGHAEVLEQKIEHKRKELIQKEKEEELKIINNKISRKKKSIKMKLNWLPSKLERGVISQDEYDGLYMELSDQYDKLVAKQKNRNPT